MAARLTTLVVAGIVAATLIAGLIVGAQRDDNDGPVDLIVHHARVYTSAGAPLAEALAIRGNQVLRVGSDRDVLRLRRPQTEVIDAEGGAVLPGFDDAHVRLLEGGAAFDGVNLIDAPTVEDVDRRIRDWAEANPDRPWVVGRGWRPGSFPAAPTRQQLDRLVPDRPAQIVDEAGQALWVNSRALELAHLTGDAGRTPGAREPRASDTSGVLTGAAATAVRGLLPQPSGDERARALRSAIAEAHRYGITSVQDIVESGADLATYAEARRSGDLQLRVYASLAVDHVPSESELDALGQLLDQYPDDPLFKGGAVSLTLDTGSDSGGPAMLGAEPNAGPSGTTRFDADGFNRLVRRLDARGWQILTNAAGDRAVRMALDAYAHAERSNPPRSHPRRHRIENAAFIATEDLSRFKTLNVLASLQPHRETLEPAGAAVRARHLEPGLERDGWAAVDIRREGGRLAFGSGWPLGSLDPLLGLQAAVERAADGTGAVRAAARGIELNLDRAIEAYTAGSAWASFDEQRKGSLEPGMLADLVVLSGDIFAHDADALGAARVAVTVFDGQIVYRRGAAGTN